MAEEFDLSAEHAADFEGHSPLPGLEHLGRAITDSNGFPSGSPANYEAMRADTYEQEKHLAHLAEGPNDAEISAAVKSALASIAPEPTDEEE